MPLLEDVRVLLRLAEQKKRCARPNDRIFMPWLFHWQRKDQ